MGRHWLTVSRWERLSGHMPSKESMKMFEAIERTYEHSKEKLEA
jgi:hypothetical protein